MPHVDTISLREHRPEAPAPPEPPRASQAPSMQRVRVRVLVGNGVLQLPIWGFAMSYGVVQEYLSTHWVLDGNQELTGIIGTTFNGVIYLSMPALFALFSTRWAPWRQTAALSGALLLCLSFVASSFSQTVWHLIATQAVLAPLGCALMYSPATLSLGEWFQTGHRAVAYGVVLSCKNVAGSVCPFLLRALLAHHDLRLALRIWAAIAAATSVPTIFCLIRFTTPARPDHSPPHSPSPRRRRRRLPWHFLRHRTIYIYTTAIILQSSGYGIPQTYLNTYAHDVALLSQTSATLLLTLFNLPGILASFLFGYLSDNNSNSNSNSNRRPSLPAATITSIPAIGSALAAFLLWGLASRGSTALLVLFSLTFGFFAGGYSATWGSVLNELEREAAERNEAVDTGLLYGLLNGARGVGYVSGGLVGVPLLKAGAGASLGSWGYGTSYGPLIVFTGLSSVFGGWAVLWKGPRLLSCV